MRIKEKYHSLTTEYFSIVAKKHHVDCWNNLYILSISPTRPQLGVKQKKCWGSGELSSGCFHIAKDLVSLNW